MADRSGMSFIQECLTPLNIVVHYIHAVNPNCTEIYNSPLPVVSFDLKEYIKVFSMTYLLELPIYWIFLKGYFNINRLFLVNFILNIATHPIVYLAMPVYFLKWNLNYIQYLGIAEVFAPAIEALLLKNLFLMRTRHAIWAAVIANLFSWTIGIYWNF